jgi:hypothetical protein
VNKVEILEGKQMRIGTTKLEFVNFSKDATVERNITVTQSVIFNVRWP